VDLLGQRGQLLGQGMDLLGELGVLLEQLRSATSTSRVLVRIISFRNFL
jgi:hypothetical protein